MYGARTLRLHLTRMQYMYARTMAYITYNFYYYSAVYNDLCACVFSENTNNNNKALIHPLPEVL